jgi:hypothetical protein
LLDFENPVQVLKTKTTDQGVPSVMWWSHGR